MNEPRSTPHPHWNEPKPGETKPAPAPNTKPAPEPVAPTPHPIHGRPALKTRAAEQTYAAPDGFTPLDN